MPTTIIQPFKEYLPSNVNTTVQTIAIQGIEGQIDIIYSVPHCQLTIINQMVGPWDLSSNLEFWDGATQNITKYPIDFTIPYEAQVYLNPDDITKPNPDLVVEDLNTSCFFKDLSLVNQDLKLSLQWDALLKRMPNDQNRLLLQGDILETR